MISSAFTSLIFAVSFIATVSAASSGIAPIQITNNPNTKAKICENFTLTWKGGAAPYTVTMDYFVPAVTGNSTTEVSTTFTNVQRTSFSTKLNIPPNAHADDGIAGSVRFGVHDEQVNVNTAPAFDLAGITGDDTSCLPMLSTINNTITQSPFQNTALRGPRNTVSECSTSTFKILGVIPTGEDRNGLTFQSVGISNLTVQIKNILDNTVSIKLPFPAGTSFTTALGSAGGLAGDIQRNVTAGTSECVTPV